MRPEVVEHCSDGRDDLGIWAVESPAYDLEGRHLCAEGSTICDGPRAADGRWVRYRMVWVPAHNVPLRTSCSSTTTGGYFQQEQVFEKVKYPVTDDTVVPGEPGWLPPTYTDAGGVSPINV